MRKIVTENSRNTYLTLDDTSECTVIFSAKYRIFTIRNTGDSVVYASLNQGITANTDGVYTVNAGEVVNIAFLKETDTIYIKGSGTAEIYAGNIPVAVFNGVGGVVKEYIPEGEVVETTTDDIDEMFDDVEDTNGANVSDNDKDFIDDMFKGLNPFYI